MSCPSSKWIKIEDQKPPLNQYVLICKGKRYEIAKRIIGSKGGDVYHNGSYGVAASNILAWMEIEKYD